MDPHLLCLTAPNPGPFTGDGTNTWVVGAEHPLVIDPGPDLPAHHAAILGALGGRKPAAILVTHAHRDHCALARPLGAALRVPVIAAAHPHGPGARDLPPGPGTDPDFRPDLPCQHEAPLSLGGLTVTALHTPGHLGGHFCFALGDLLFCGDHVMGWSTTTVLPPEGDMAAYRASLRLLAQSPWRRLFPGHGGVIEAPSARLQTLIAHRDTREAQILAVLHKGPATVAALAESLYPGLPPALQKAAQGNVEAHLIQLHSENRVAPWPQTRALTALAYHLT